jgi:hypothetical protein
MAAPTPIQVEVLKPLFEISDYISIAAIFLGPIVGIQLQKFLERQSAANSRREKLFKTLMSTRGTSLSPFHVEALNSIDLEFSSSKKYKNVLSAWDEYIGHLNSAIGEGQIAVWLNNRETLLINLLFEMSQSLGFAFDRALIKRHSYVPTGHGAVEEEDNTIRKGLATLLQDNEGYLQMVIMQDEEVLKKQNELQELMIKHYTPKGDLPKFENEDSSI